MGEPWYTEFDGAFWLTLAGALFGFGGVFLQAILKSRCKKFSCCCISCDRDVAPPGEEPEIDVPKSPETPKRAPIQPALNRV